MEAFPIAAFIVMAGLFLATGIRIIKEYERGVVLRLGSYTGAPNGPGLVWIIPVLDKMFTVDMRVVARDVPPQDVITRTKGGDPALIENQKVIALTDRKGSVGHDNDRPTFGFAAPYRGVQRV